jgi:hypothetical protein
MPGTCRLFCAKLVVHTSVLWLDLSPEAPGTCGRIARGFGGKIGHAMYALPGLDKRGGISYNLSLCREVIFHDQA